ncbi:MAG: SET domain-containing protein-lysine N-methyltransferase, partial [Fimbriiglobus sp.]
GIPGAGLGLFCRVPLAAGDVLRVVGVLIDADSAADRCTRYADENKYRVDGRRLLIPVGFGAMANHSDAPNAEKVVDGDDVWLRFPRPIAAGEEIVWRYSNYARDRFGIGG